MQVRIVVFPLPFAPVSTVRRGWMSRSTSSNCLQFSKLKLANTGASLIVARVNKPQMARC